MKKSFHRVNPYLLGGKLKLPKADRQRFFRKQKNSGKCILWTGRPLQDGYGQFVFRVEGIKVKERAHRVAYYLCVGKVPEGMMVCHECDTPMCVNPDHLWLGDSLTNNGDRNRKGRSNPQSGGEHWSRRNPEKVARGDRSAVKRHPEKYRGENHSQAKLTEEQVRRIRLEVGATSRKDLAQKFQISRTQIDLIVTRKSWKHI